VGSSRSPGSRATKTRTSAPHGDPDR
jgi:hypothetical protein